MIFETVKVKDVKTKIGELVRLLRKKQGLSQEELAATLNLSRITIQNLEAGQNPTLDTVLKTLQYFELLDKFNQYIIDTIDNNQYTSLY
jgi:transcriptional regulator with XRE-family HTH domain